MARMSADKRIKQTERTRDNILYIMQIRRKSVKDAADYMDMAPKTLQAKIDDPQRFTFEQMITLANLLNVDVGFFVCGKITFEAPAIAEV